MTGSRMKCQTFLQLLAHDVGHKVGLRNDLSGTGKSNAAAKSIYSWPSVSLHAEPSPTHGIADGRSHGTPCSRHQRLL